MKRRLLSVFMIFCMLASLFPTVGIAEDSTEAEQPAEALDILPDEEQPGEVEESAGLTEPEEDPEGDAAAEEPDEQEPVHEHVYEALVTEPTCTEQGYTTYTCACGESYVDVYTDAFGHSPEGVAEIPAAVGQEGVTAGVICSACGEVLEGCEGIPALTETEKVEVPIEEEIGAPAPTDEETIGEETLQEEAASAAQEEKEPEAESASDMETEAERSADTEPADSKSANEPSAELTADESGEEVEMAEKPEEEKAKETEDAAPGAAVEESTEVIIQGEKEETTEDQYTVSQTEHADPPKPLKSAAEAEGLNREAMDATSGKCGQDATWSFNTGGGLLTISGTGAVTSCPWIDYKDTIRKVVIGSGITSLCYPAFSGCSQLTEAILPGSLEGIPASAFRGCSSLEYMIIPDNVASIEMNTFDGCSSLTEVTIPGKVTIIKSDAFNGCRSLTKLTISSGVEYIAQSAFEDCSALTSVAIPGTVKEVGKEAFANCTALKTLNIQSGVTSIGWKAFSECSSLTHVTIPETVTAIEGYAFSHCIALTALTLPICLNTIGEGAFDWCSGLTSVTIPGSVENFEKYAFENCYRLTKVIISPGVTSIPFSGFYNCLGLTEVSIPNTVTSIDSSAFHTCSSLTSVTIPGSVKEIKGYVFAECTDLNTVTFEEGIEHIGSGAFENCTKLRAVYFNGEAPVFEDDSFAGAKATIFYPPGWPDSVLKNYGGLLNWVEWQNLSAPVLTEAFNSATGVRVSWKAVGGASKYRLLRKNLTKNETTWSNVGETTELTLIDKTAASASRYTYTVECIDNNGYAASPRDETGRTCTYIAKADITKLAAGVKGVTITWSKPAGAKNFRVMRRQDGTNKWTVIAVVEGTSYTDTAAPKGVKLWYTVRGVSMDNKVVINSYNGTGWSLYHVNPPVMTEAFNSATGVRVSWKKVTGASKYRLLRKNVTKNETTWTTIAETKDLTFIDKSAVSSNRYTYTVQCIDANGRTSSAINAAGRTCTYIAMSKITTIGSVTNGVKLVWSKPAGAKNFRVMRRQDGTDKWTVIKVIQGTSFVDTTAKKNVKYWYTVRGVSMDNTVVINSYNATGWSVTRK